MICYRIMNSDKIKTCFWLEYLKHVNTAVSVIVSQQWTICPNLTTPSRFVIVLELPFPACFQTTYVIKYSLVSAIYHCIIE